MSPWHLGLKSNGPYLPEKLDCSFQWKLTFFIKQSHSILKQVSLSPFVSLHFRSILILPLHLLEWTIFSFPLFQSCIFHRFLRICITSPHSTLPCPKQSLSSSQMVSILPNVMTLLFTESDVSRVSYIFIFYSFLFYTLYIWLPVLIASFIQQHITPPSVTINFTLIMAVAFCVSLIFHVLVSMIF